MGVNGEQTQNNRAGLGRVSKMMDGCTLKQPKCRRCASMITETQTPEEEQKWINGWNDILTVE